ncbi:MAG: Uma2 family endonuclease [Anaerolineales bacterium]|nr:Uma2 family endonuclease [Anaerolineales bacterium]
MLAQERRLYSHAEYFALEEQAQVKSEYRCGEIIAMAGTSLNHNRIAKNVSFAIDQAVAGKSCESFIGDVRLWIERRDFYTYPDVMVVCGPPQFAAGRTDTVTNPVVLIEVLSESTAAYDRGDKFQAYWTLPSLAEYVLIDQYRLRVDYFQRISEKEWRLLVLTKKDEALAFESIEVSVLLEQIYRNVVWEAGR